MDCWFSRRHHYFPRDLALGKIAEMNLIMLKDRMESLLKEAYELGRKDAETQCIETDVNVQHVISAKPLEDNEWAKKWTGKTIDITEEEDDEQED